jgi:hypothetical protein
MPTERTLAMIEEFANAPSRGASTDDTLAVLRQRGLNAIEAIRVIQRVYGLDAKSAKIALDTSLAWADIVRASEPAPDAMEEAARLLAEE